MTTSQFAKGERFRALHESPGCFVIPNPWDAGTAKILESLGFEALATTSAGCAFSLGLSDGRGSISKETTYSNAAAIVDSVDLPVSADLEDGWGLGPEDISTVIERASEVGLVGASIEDASDQVEGSIYPFELAVERIRAAAEAAHGLDIPFTLTARAENFLHGRPDLADTIRRLQAFQEAGADVLYAPGLANIQDIASVVASVDRPVNVVMGLAGLEASVSDLAEVGVSRISVGSALIRAAFGELVRGAKEILEQGTFGFASSAMPFGDLNALFRDDSTID